MTIAIDGPIASVTVRRGARTLQVNPSLIM